MKSLNVFQNVKWGFDNGMMMCFVVHQSMAMFAGTSDDTMQHTACFGCRVLFFFYLLGPSMLRWTKHVIALLCSTRFKFEKYLDLSTQ